MTQSNKRIKPAVLAIGATFAVSVAASSLAHAATPASNPFAMNDLHSAYSQLADASKDAKCGGDKAQAQKKEEGKAMTKEGKCGGNKPAPKEGKCGGSK